MRLSLPAREIGNFGVVALMSGYGARTPSTLRSAALASGMRHDKQKPLRLGPPRRPRSGRHSLDRGNQRGHDGAPRTA